MSKSKFTLIELLVVVAIIGILASILMPSLQKARETAKTAVCKSNKKQVGIAVATYQTGHDDITLQYCRLAFTRGLVMKLITRKLDEPEALKND